MENETFTFKDGCYKNSKEEVILGITIDNKLNFDSHIKNICKKPVKNEVPSQEYQHF